MFGKSLVIGIAAVAAWPLAGQPRVEQATLASQVLQHTDIARQAIAHRDRQAALDHVAQALSVAGKINSTYVPIASEFDAVSTTVPAKRQGSADRLKHNASISEVSGTYTATILNVSSARNQLMATQAALEKGDLEAADLDLVAVQSDVVTKSFSGDLPLVRAKQNLELALTRVKDGNYKDAILPLKSASRALDKYAHQNPAPPPADLASRYSLDMDAYAERIAKDHADAADRIAGWRDKVTDWFYSGMAL
jgi:hypothetical protein